MSVRTLLAVFLLAGVAGAGRAADEDWQKLPDGSTGKETSYRGVGDIVIPAYVRKPPGPGPFPVVVLLHGGKYSKQATFGLGRSSRPPVQDFINTGWAVYAIDYRPQDRIVLDPTEIDDCVLAVKAVCEFPFIDPKRVGLHGGSHGANLTSRLIARVPVSGPILCAPAAMDLIEVTKALDRGEKLVMILSKLVADMEKKHGATAAEIEKDPKKYGYSRALDGFSMGGFGAAHFGFKFPELFGVVSIQAPPLLGPDLNQALPARAWSKLFPNAMGGDLDYFRTNDPFALIATHADALRDRSMIRIVTHVETENWLAPRCEELHQVLMKHTIAHQFFYLSNVKSHNRAACMDSMGDAGLAFFGSSFAYLQKKAEAKGPK